MLPVLNELQSGGLLSIRIVPQGNYEERRPVAMQDPVLTFFSPQDLAFLDRSISAYWDKTGKEVSDISHGSAWGSREDGEPMPYELAYLSDQPVGRSQRARLLKLAEERGWTSK
jgi:hypothetical protein